MHLDEASAIIVEQTENCLHLHFSVPHVHRLHDESHKSFEVDAVVAFSLNLCEVQDPFKDLVQKWLLALDVNCFQIVEQLVEADLFVLYVHVAFKGIL